MRVSTFRPKYTRIKIFHVDRRLTDLPEVFFYYNRFNQELAAEKFGGIIASLMDSLFDLGIVDYVSVRDSDIYIQAKKEIPWEFTVDSVIRDWLNSLVSADQKQPSF